jgi:iron complex transport system substrate-binding protein
VPGTPSRHQAGFSIAGSAASFQETAFLIGDNPAQRIFVEEHYMHNLTVRKKLHAFFVLVTVAVFGAACGQPEVTVEQAPAEPAEAAAPATEEQAEAVVAPEANITAGCVDGYAEDVDYFPEKAVVEYATNFTVEYFNNYKVVTTLTPWPGAEQSFQYVLVQCGTPAPEGYGDTPVINVPATTTVTMSTNYIAQMEDLGLLDHLAGLDSALYVINPAVREMIEAGELAEIAPGGQVNVEVALELDPSLIMAYSAGVPEYDTHPVLIDAGLPVVMNADWMEQTPLARAEWIKFMALFYNVEARAEAVFDDIATQYEEAAGLAAGVAKKPTVFSDTPYEGTWYVPGGQSYTAHLFADAGADYVWADDESTGTLFLDAESVFDRAQDADIWVNVWGYGSREDMLAVDERFADFKAFQDGAVFGNDARGNEFGTEIWETGVARPHLVLLDLIKIFHPELLPDHELYYYRQMP